MSTPFAFFDSIFDRYYYLVRSMDAGVDQISVAMGARLASTRSEKLLRVSPVIVDVDDHQRFLIDKCSATLPDPIRRALYDDKLASFKEKEPHLVSPNGISKIEPSRFEINSNSLLGDASDNMEAIETQTLSMPGMDEKPIIKEHRRLDAGPRDPDARECARGKLAKNIALLSLLDDLYWQIAGVNGSAGQPDPIHAQSESPVTAKLAERADSTRSTAGSGVERRDGVVRLGLAPRRLLSGPGILAHNDPENKGILASSVLAESAIAAFYKSSGPLTQDATAAIETPTASREADWPNELVAPEPHPEMTGLLMESIALASKLAD